MRKKILAVLFGTAAVACGAFALSGCSVTNPTPTKPHHQHYFTAYDYDDIQHWSICPDDGKMDPTSYRYHDFKNGDCVCGKEGHKHAWSEEWSTDDYSHWHDCETCDDYDHESIKSHVADVLNFETTLFDETSHWYVCEVCDREFNAEEHSEQPGTAKDDEGHWTACWRCNYKINYQEHDFSNGDKCACGYDLKGTEGLEYEMVNGYYVLKGIGTATGKNIVIPSVHEGATVLKIGDSAFKDCAEIESVRIPETVTEIGASAFANCTGIESITLPSNLKTVSSSAFSGCTKLESIALNGGENDKLAVIDGILYGKSERVGGVETSSVIAIPSAVKGTVNVPDGVSTMSFKNIKGLQKVVFGAASKMTKIADSAFEGCDALTEVVLPANLTQIGNRAFYNCGELTTLIFPEKLTKIGQTCFFKCEKLTEISIPSSVTEIGRNAFSSCSGLTDLTFGEDIEITEIGDSVFLSCHSLRSIKIPEGVKTLGRMAFQRCINLTSATLPTTLTSIDESAFNSCEKLTKIAIPAEVTSIGGSAFYKCYLLEEVTFGENSKLKTTATLSFGSCTSLTSVALPDSLETVGNSLFNGCTNLSEIIIGENSRMKTIGNLSFINCAITYIVIPPLSVPESGNSIGNTIFDGCGELTKIYYKGTKAEWESLKIDSRDESLPTDSRLSFFVENEADVPADGGSYWHFADGAPVEW